MSWLVTYVYVAANKVPADPAFRHNGHLYAIIDNDFISDCNLSGEEMDRAEKFELERLRVNVAHMISEGFHL